MILHGVPNRLLQQTVFLCLLVVQIQQQLEAFGLELLEHHLLSGVTTGPVDVGLADQLMKDLQGLSGEGQLDLVVFF